MTMMMYAHESIDRNVLRIRISVNNGGLRKLQ